MKVYLNRISGIEEAIISMFISKRNWSRDLEEHVFDVCSRVLDRNGRVRETCTRRDIDQFNEWIDKLVKFGWRHITLLKFIDISVTVDGLHRAGQDDWDSHAKRFDNRIIRSSTRLATFGNEMSSWYESKIMSMDDAIKILDIALPEKIEANGSMYVRTTNGYIKEDLAENKDVKRGLYMLSIPSTFTFKCNLAEYAHVYKERNVNGTANPEVKELCETITDLIQSFVPMFNRDLFEKIKN